jgi:thioredoxin reductase (NADPH)
MITSEDLRSVKSFEGLSEPALALAASRCAEYRLAPGEWLIGEGDVPRFFAVISGELETIKNSGGVERLLTTFEAGESFGEVPLILGSGSVGSVRATAPSRVASLEAIEFWRLVHSQASFAEAVAKALSARIGFLWSAALEVPRARCTIVGDPNSPDCHRLRDFLTRLHVPFDWEERRSDRCDVTFDDGRRLISPTIRELAEALGLQTEPKNHCYDVAIVGAGPAGLAAAVYGASEGLNTILIEQYAPGGQAGMSSRIENYLGYPNGISGEELADRAYRQVTRFGADVVATRQAVRIEGDAYARRVVLDGGETVHAHAVVLATGVSYRSLTVPGCDDFLNRGVFYGAAQAEARRVSGQRIHLLGGGNSAGQAAMFFSHYAERVTIVIRGDDLAKSMSQYLIDEIHKRPNITVIRNHEVSEVIGHSELEALVLKDVTNGQTTREPTNALFVFIGADARTDWLDGFVAIDGHGYVCTGPAANDAAAGWSAARQPMLLETSQIGIFAVGDVRKGSVKRVAAGVGEGSTAITMIHQLLAEMKNKTEQLA